MLRCVIGSPEIYLGEEKEENFKNRKQKYENQHVLSFGAHASPLANRVMVSSLPVVTEQTQRSYTFYTHFANEKTEARRSSIYPRDLCFFFYYPMWQKERGKRKEKLRGRSDPRKSHWQVPQGHVQGCTMARTHGGTYTKPSSLPQVWTLICSPKRICLSENQFSLLRVGNLFNAERPHICSWCFLTKLY